MTRGSRTSLSFSFHETFVTDAPLRTPKARTPASISQALDASPVAPSFAYDIHSKPLPPKPSSNASEVSLSSNGSRSSRTVKVRRSATSVSLPTHGKHHRPKLTLSVPPSPGPPPSMPLPLPPRPRPIRVTKAEYVTLPPRTPPKEFLRPKRNNSISGYPPRSIEHLRPEAEKKKRHSGHFFGSLTSFGNRSPKSAKASPSPSSASKLKAPPVSYRPPAIALTRTMTIDNIADSLSDRSQKAPAKLLKPAPRGRPLSLPPPPVGMEYVPVITGERKSRSKRFSLQSFSSNSLFTDSSSTIRVKRSQSLDKGSSISRSRSRGKRQGVILRRPLPLSLTPDYALPTPVSTPIRPTFHSNALNWFPNLLVFGVLVHWFWIIRLWIPSLPAGPVRRRIRGGESEDEDMGMGSSQAHTSGHGQELTPITVASRFSEYDSLRPNLNITRGPDYGQDLDIVPGRALHARRHRNRGCMSMVFSSLRGVWRSLGFN